eukprot:TRINITY_DN4370_c0_g1_i1.p1 TRINITY_DN4370_c0_g1~~TRINITY_DN4370_c0_g1_i1.p1  ORF type:complete len:371 (-),score=-22.00 TRINITY_DN4370_c0_g1_i1:493-1470(-)
MGPTFCDGKHKLSKKDCLTQHFESVSLKGNEYNQVNVDELCESIEETPIDMNSSDPKVAVSMMQQGKSVVCLQCGTLILGDFEKHYNEKGHYTYIKGQDLVCKKCEHSFTAGEITEKVSDMLMEVAMAMTGKLPELLEMATADGNLPGMPQLLLFYLSFIQQPYCISQLAQSTLKNQLKNLLSKQKTLHHHGAMLGGNKTNSKVQKKRSPFQSPLSTSSLYMVRQQGNQQMYCAPKSQNEAFKVHSKSILFCVFSNQKHTMHGFSRSQKNKGGTYCVQSNTLNVLQYTKERGNIIINLLNNWIQMGIGCCGGRRSCLERHFESVI